jgi:hypothetical protein
MATIEFEEDAIRIDATIIGQGLGEGPACPHPMAPQFIFEQGQPLRRNYH